MATESVVVTTCDQCGKQNKRENRESLPVGWVTMALNVFGDRGKHLRTQTIEACSRICAATRLRDLGAQGRDNPGALFGPGPMPDGGEGD